MTEKTIAVTSEVELNTVDLLKAEYEETEGLTEKEKALLEKERRINADLDKRLAANPNALPRAVYFILPNEFGERFTFYGISALVNRYLQVIINDPVHGKVHAKELTHYWKLFTYFFPLVGAAISDSFLGKYKTIVYLSAVYLIGIIVLVITSIPKFRTLVSASIGLYLIAFGTGGIKPCVGPHGGDQFLKVQVDGIRRFFAFFYVSINLGALLTGFVTPPLATSFGCNGEERCYTAAFSLPAAVFFVAYVLFVYGHKYYRVVPPTGTFIPARMAVVIGRSIVRYFAGARPAPGASFFTLASDAYGEQFATETGEFLRMFLQIVPLSFVWMVYDQQSTEWQNQYDRMNQYFGSLYLSPEVFIAIVNPCLVVPMVAILSSYVYPFLDKRGIACTSLRRMALGSILVMIGFILSGFVQSSVLANFDGELDKSGQQIPGSCKNCVHGGWQIPQWFILSLGESMFSPTGNEFSYTQVGKATRAMSSSFWLLLVALGNFYVVWFEGVVGEATWAINENGDTKPAKYYVYSAICAGAILWFVGMAMRFKYRPGTM
ncbi:POT family-domain-containing protein [Catenaria anguillulae PL171]|uniref:POT family-domain-containing protein n=1 Tax=Catenaria anguillulae PL171 TaxID=765915 RepID=A0A1Y2HDV9_9FUNG|nr:POT family-domain-containing protein [Catenaria anguillulae PL171]